MDAFLVPERTDSDADDATEDTDSECDQQDCHGSVRFGSVSQKTVLAHAGSGSHRFTKNDRKLKNPKTFPKHPKRRTAMTGP